MMFFKLIIIFLFFVVNLTASSQFTHPQYRQYTLRDGLSQMQVISMFQDSRGYIWAGTKEGLNCFNGDQIISFDEKDGLASTYIQKITEDFEGNIWVSTRKGFSRFNGKTWKSFSPENFYVGYVAPMPDGKVWYLAIDRNYKALFGYLENDELHDQLELLPELDNPDGAEIAYCKASQTLIFHDRHNLFELKNGVVKKIHQAKENLYFELQDSVILFLETNQKDFVNLFEYAKGKLNELASIRNGRLIGENHSTSEFAFFPRLGENPLYFINPDTLIINPFPEMHKSCCLTDKDGQLWIGTEEGLYRIQSNGFETYKREILPAIWSILEDSNQNIWFASYNYGLRKFNGKSLTTFSVKDIEKHGLEQESQKYGLNFYFHPSVDKRGTLYFPFNPGILAYDGKFFKINDRIGCLTTFYDHECDLLWGGYRLFAEVYNKEHKLIRTIGQTEGLGLNGYVATIGKDINGHYWLGGFTGLCRYNWDSKKFENYNRDNGRLPADGVISNFNTPDGRTWFGSTHGLLYYDAKTESIRKIEREEISGTVNFVSAIDSTWLVFSQSTGIYLMDLKKFNRSGAIELYFFNENNGFLGIDPGQDGAMVDSNGNIWMTTSTEVVKLNPKKLKLQKKFIAVRFLGFNGERITYNDEMVELPRNQRSAIFTFDAICYNRPSPVQYSWKLSTDTVWSVWQIENYAFVSNLTDGKSEIMLRVKFPGLPDTKATSSLMVKVRVAVWKQPWFFPTLFGLFALLSILGFVLFLHTRTQMMLTARQSKVFQVQAIQSQMNPHFIFNVLASFQSMILSFQSEKANLYLVKLAGLIRGFLDASTGSANLQNSIILEKEQTLQNEIELINGFVEFQQLIYPNKFEYIINTDSAINPEQETIPPMILQPFVENAIRHGLLPKNGVGILKLEITRKEEKGLRIIIADNGIGIEKAGRILTDSPFRYESKGTMLTLNRIKLLNELGYKITIITESSDKGTKIEITILNHEQRY
jgi:ligand-binding sensor domain-containing protein